MDDLKSPTSPSNDAPEGAVTATVWPPHAALVAHLKEGGLLTYGQEIPWAVITELWHCDLEALKTYSGGGYLGEMMKLREVMRDMGFKLSERGMNGVGVRILTREEMPDNVAHLLQRGAHAAMNACRMLSHVPRDGLPDSVAHAINFQEIRSAFVGAATKRMLAMRELPPTVDMARKLAQRMTERNAHE